MDGRDWKMWIRGLTAGAFVAAMMVSGGAMATNVTQCSSIGKIDDWKDASGDSCIQGDKKFTLISTNLSDHFDIDFDVSANGFVHTFHSDETLYSDAYIKYKIEVLDPLYEITGVKLTSDIENDSDTDDTIVKKKIYTSVGGTLIDELVVTGDGSDSVTGLHASILYIEDWIDIRDNNESYLFSNEFTQGLKTTSVPEPMTLGLLGAGLLGLGAVARRRRAA